MSYIKKELLLADILDAKIKNTQEESQRVLNIFERMVQKQPDVDVVEVRHGYWKDRFKNKYANHYYECSVCGKSALDGTKYNQLGNPEIIEVLSDFCPHCGAKMDDERKSENE